MEKETEDSDEREWVGVFFGVAVLNDTDIKIAFYIAILYERER